MLPPHDFQTQEGSCLYDHALVVLTDTRTSKSKEISSIVCDASVLKLTQASQSASGVHRSFGRKASNVDYAQGVGYANAEISPNSSLSC